jgi:hypothetical protein
MKRNAGKPAIAFLAGITGRLFMAGSIAFLADYLMG